MILKIPRNFIILHFQIKGGDCPSFQHDGVMIAKRQDLPVNVRDQRRCG